MAKGTKALGIINLVAVFLPVVVSLIRMIEGWYKGKLTGVDKKAQSMTILAAVWGGLQAPGPAHLDLTDDLDFEDFAPMLGLLIDSSVSVANTIGEFTK